MIGSPIPLMWSQPFASGKCLEVSGSPGQAGLAGIGRSRPWRSRVTRSQSTRCTPSSERPRHNWSIPGALLWGRGSGAARPSRGVTAGPQRGTVACAVKGDFPQASIPVPNSRSCSREGLATNFRICGTRGPQRVAIVEFASRAWLALVNNSRLLDYGSPHKGRLPAQHASTRRHVSQACVIFKIYRANTQRLIKVFTATGQIIAGPCGGQAPGGHADCDHNKAVDATMIIFIRGALTPLTSWSADLAGRPGRRKIPMQT